MTATGQRPEIIQIEQLARQCLVDAIPESDTWTVRCQFRQGKLIVLVQHPAGEEVSQRLVFGVLEAALQDSEELQLLEARSPDFYSVRLYLREQGQRDPYGFYRFVWEAPGTASLELFNDEEILPPHEAAVAPEDPTQPDSAIAPATLLPPTPIASHEATYTPPSVLDVEVEQSKRLWYGRLVSRPGSRIAISAGIAAGLMLLVGGGYALSRPCVIGRCVPLETAQQYAQDAAAKTTSESSAQDVVDAYESLTEASFLLSKIPAWSGQYESAQTLMAGYDAEAQKLERVVQAQRLAMDAAVKSQNPPHPIVVWREVQQLRQGAIAELENVPSDSPVYELAQRKLQEYQNNLTQIDQRIRREVEAQEWINVARQTAALAETRQDSATDLQSWRQVQATWQTVIDALRKIPSGTMAHAEAQQLLALYQAQLQKAEERVQQEEAGAQAVSRATALAAEAEETERRNQWSQATTHWEQALAAVQQVQEGSLAYDQAQPMASSYEQALSNARSNLQTSTAMQAALADLGTICGTNPRLCTSVRQGDRLEVRLTDAYERAIAPNGVTPVSTDRMNQMNPMLRAIANISEGHSVPTELYEANGSLFGIYDPRVDGYVPELN